MRSSRLQRKDQVSLDEDNKDREVLREGPSAVAQSKMDRGILKDYSLKHQVTIEYNMNDDSMRDRIFKLKVDDYEVLLDWEELMRIGRFI